MERGTVMSPSAIAGSSLLCWVLLWSWVAFANERTADELRPPSALSDSLRSAGWMLLTLPGKAGGRFDERSDGAIEVSANSGVAFLYRTIPNDMGPKRRLAWRWRIDRPVPPTDLSKAGEDDRSFAVHICFPVETGSGSLWDGMVRLATRVFAAPLSGKVLTYVWGGTRPRGALMANPHLEPDGRIIVLRSGDGATGFWQAEEIDFVADFRKAFGYNPPAPAYLAISVDSDDTASRSRGAVADLAFGG